MVNKIKKKVNELNLIVSEIKPGVAFNKKGTSEMWWIIAAAVIAMIAIIVIVVWFTGAGGILFGGLDRTIGGLKDYDRDGVSDLLDKCPCDEDLQQLASGQSCPRPKSDCDELLKKAKIEESAGK